MCLLRGEEERLIIMSSARTYLTKHYLLRALVESSLELVSPKTHSSGQEVEWQPGGIFSSQHVDCVFEGGSEKALSLMMSKKLCICLCNGEIWGL